MEVVGEVQKRRRWWRRQWRQSAVWRQRHSFFVDIAASLSRQEGSGRFLHRAAARDFEAVAAPEAVVAPEAVAALEAEAVVVMAGIEVRQLPDGAHRSPFSASEFRRYSLPLEV